jgi:hypothetical protein
MSSPFPRSLVVRPLFRFAFFPARPTTHFSPIYHDQRPDLFLGHISPNIMIPYTY